MKKNIVIVILLAWFSRGLHAQSRPSPDRLQVSADGHFLSHANNAPFFWLGDTGWELFHRLDSGEIKQYLDNRAAKGFTVIQAVVLAEMDGLHRPNRYGQLPLVADDPLRPNEAYFKLIDSTVAWAAARGLYMALLPTWGDKVTPNWGAGPVIFDSARAYQYGKWISNRYKNNPNIIWILGGDRPAVRDTADWRPIWRAMAKGLHDGATHTCLIAYHPWGGSNSTSQWIHQEPWLNINMFQSGHGAGHDVPCWELVTRDRQLTPAKPTLDAEPNYEDHPVSPWPKWNTDSGYFRAYDVRKQLYRSVFAGACGVTYGHHAVWQFMSAREEAINYPDRGWINAMDRPGAFQAGYLRRLMDHYPGVNQVPGNDWILTANGIKGNYQQACHSKDGRVAMVYEPVGQPITISLQQLHWQQTKATWFDPRTGSSQAAPPAGNTPALTFTPPTTGIENDWVLILERL